MPLTPERLREWIDALDDADDLLAHPKMVDAAIRDEHDGGLQRLSTIRDEMLEAWRDLLTKEVA